MAADRVPQIDIRLNEIGIREQATQNEQLLVLLAQERLAMTNERISLTSPATQPGNYPVVHAGVGFGYIVYIYPKPHPGRYTR